MQKNKSCKKMNDKDNNTTSNKIYNKTIINDKLDSINNKEESESNNMLLSSTNIEIICDDMDENSNNEERNVNNNIVLNKYLIYDVNIYIFRMFAIVILCMSRSIIEVRNVLNITDNVLINKLKNLYLLTFLACIFIFTYNSGKSYVKSILTLHFKKNCVNKLNETERKESISRRYYKLVMENQTFISIKNLLCKSFVKYLLSGFILLYFIQPFSYYISTSNPDWIERITLSPMNFYLDSLDRIILKTNMDINSNKIVYFSQIMIYLFFIRIICFPIISSIKYTIEIFFNEVNQSNFQVNNKEGISESTIMEFSNTAFKPSIKEETSLLLTKQKQRSLSRYENEKKYFFFYYEEQEFSHLKLTIQFLQLITILLFLLYIGLTKFIFIFIMPMIFPIITFNLTRELSSVIKIKIMLIFTYLLTISLFIFVENQPFIWKSSLIFLLGAIDSLLSCLNKQYDHYCHHKRSSSSLFLFLINILLVFFLTTIYILFFKIDGNKSNYKPKSMELLREVSVLFLTIILSSHPFVQFKSYLIERKDGIKQINKKNRKLSFFIFVHPLMIRLVSYYFELKPNIGLSAQLFILIVTFSSVLLTFLFYYALLVMYTCIKFVGNKIKLLVEMFKSSKPQL